MEIIKVLDYIRDGYFLVLMNSNISYHETIRTVREDNIPFHLMQEFMVSQVEEVLSEVREVIDWKREGF